jgi:hypothetical protein
MRVLVVEDQAELADGGQAVRVRGACREGPVAGPALTRKEMGILEELLVADGGVVSTEDLLERVWGENADVASVGVQAAGDGVLRRRRRRLAGAGSVEERVPATGATPCANDARRSRLVSSASKCTLSSPAGTTS